MNITDSQLRDIIQECVSHPSETEWIEFKVNNSEYNQVGRRISALSNSACLNSKEYGFLIYGIEDETHHIVGTSFSPQEKKEGGQPFLFKLEKDLSPNSYIINHRLCRWNTIAYSVCSSILGGCGASFLVFKLYKNGHRMTYLIRMYLSPCTGS